MILNCVLLIIWCLTFNITPAMSLEKDDCVLENYEANCILDVMDEHVEATAVVNHCNLPIDITFRVIYRYGNDSEQRWQYTFVTSNQNERVLIPGLILPPAPNALVYLYVRIPDVYFDLQNQSVTAVEASFIAIVSESEWEEVEFLNDIVIIESTDDCNTKQKADPLLWVVVGTFFGLMIIFFMTTGFFWFYKKRKVALDSLALVSSLESGLPGAQPYQMMGPVEVDKSNSKSRKGASDSDNKCGSSNRNSSTDPQKIKSFATYLSTGFRFGRLKEEEEANELSEKIDIKKDKSVIIGNPVLVSKSPVMHYSARTNASEKVHSNIIENKNTGRQSVNSNITIDTKPIELVGSDNLSSNVIELNNKSTESEAVHREEESELCANHTLQTEEETDSSDQGARPKVKTAVANETEAANEEEKKELEK